MTKNITFINISEEEFKPNKPPMFKVVPEEYILDTIGPNHALWFSSPEQWKDPMETIFLNAEYVRKGRSTGHPLRGKVFCTCFSSERVSEPQWKMYSEGGLSICLEINKNKLLEELDAYAARTGIRIYIGKIEYVTTRDIDRDIKNIPFLGYKDGVFSIDDEECQIKTLLLKRNAFLYEGEIRIFIVLPNDVDPKTKGIPFNYACEANQLVNRITRCPDFPKDDVIRIKHKIDWDALGFSPIKDKNNRPRKRVVNSRLYADIKHKTFKL